MTLLDGYNTAKKLNHELKLEIDKWKGLKKPTLAIIHIGNNAASLSYIKGKISAAEKVGIETKLIHLKDQISQKEVEDNILILNNDPQIDGIILQLPIPKHLNKDRLIDLISIDKDADGFHTFHQGLLYQSRETMVPATPLGIMLLLETYNIKLNGLKAVVIGRSNIVGSPVSRLLQDAGATVTICHSKTKDISAYTKDADIVVAAVGIPKFLKADMVKKDVIIVDVGINKVEGKLIGDVDFEHVSKIASYMTPVPKGVGPMTIHALLKNTVKLYVNTMKKRNSI
jgi:methylenetetrahydrofolate dehydrogenase (NADP+)/methenyltetrahydrofolate cyclohydrolase